MKNRLYTRICTRIERRNQKPHKLCENTLLIKQGKVCPGFRTQKSWIVGKYAQNCPLSMSITIIFRIEILNQLKTRLILVSS